MPILGCTLRAHPLIYDQHMKKLAALTALPLLALTACGGDSSDSASSTTSSVSSSTAACQEAKASSPDAKAAMTAKLSGGLKVMDVQTVENSANKTMRDVTVRLCGASTSGGALKTEANKIGAAMKKAPDAATIASLRVTNMNKLDDLKARVRCEDFQINTFEGAAGVENATWKTADES